MALYWRCSECKRYNSIESRKCRCGKSTTCGFLVKVEVDGVLIRRFFKDFEVAKAVNTELEKKKEIAKLARKLKGIDPGLAGLFDTESVEKGRWVKLKVFWSKYYSWLVTARKKSTVSERVSRWKKVIKPRLGERFLSEITPSVIQRLQEELLNEGYSAFHVNRTVAMIRHMMTMAVKWGYLEKHPLLGKIEMLRERKDRWTFLTQEQYLLIREKLSECYLDLYDFLVFTGARLGEALGFTWKDINWDVGVVYLGDSKTNRPRVIYLSDYVIDLLRRRRKKVSGGEDERVFRHSDSEFRRAFKRALKEAGLDMRVRVHDLRHTFASWLAMRGEPLHNIKELLGHSQISTTLRYAHLMPSVLRGAVNALTLEMERRLQGDGKVISFESYSRKKKLR